jgi:two-component system, chemotaxis family, response regulator Rcp1
VSRCQVVLIEDNPADVFLVELALKENDVRCELTTFENGQEALKALCPEGGLEANSLVPDVILLDLNTPKSDGFDVLVRLRSTAHLTNVQIAILTSSQAATDKSRSDFLGATRYIQKPSQLDAFLSTIGRAVAEMLGDRNRLSGLKAPPV